MFYAKVTVLAEARNLYCIRLTPKNLYCIHLTPKNSNIRISALSSRLRQCCATFSKNEFSDVHVADSAKHVGKNTQTRGKLSVASFTSLRKI